MRFMLYQGSRMCTCRIHFKSMPSEPALDIKTTLILLPSMFVSSVKPLTSKSLLGEIRVSPVIIAYRTGLKPLSFLSSLGFMVLKSSGSVGAFKNRFFASLPYRTKPSSSSASAMGTIPPSIY